jgi:hypothetical protein
MEDLMRRALLLGTFAMALCLPALAQEVLTIPPELPEGYPPKMGEISGEMGGKSVTWETFDFSVGAFDASAWADRDFDTKRISAHLTGYAPGDPDNRTGRLIAEASFGKALRTGKGKQPLIEVLKGEDSDGPRLSSKGQSARFVIDSIGPKVPDSYSRRVKGRIEAQLCPIDWAEETCQPITLRFDTDMQMDSTLKVRE